VCGAFPQYVINMSHLLEYEQTGPSSATVIALVGSLISLCFSPINMMAKDDIKPLAATLRHPRAGSSDLPVLRRQSAVCALLVLALAVLLPCCKLLWQHGTIRNGQDWRGMGLVVGVMIGILLATLSAGAAVSKKHFLGRCPTHAQLEDARETFAEYRKWARRRLVVLGPVILIEVIHFFPILIEHFVYRGLSRKGFIGFLAAFNAPKLMFLLMMVTVRAGDWKYLYKYLVPVVGVVLSCAVLLWRHGTVHDSTGAGLLAGVAIGLLSGVWFLDLAGHGIGYTTLKHYRPTGWRGGALPPHEQYGPTGWRGGALPPHEQYAHHDRRQPDGLHEVTATQRRMGALRTYADEQVAVDRGELFVWQHPGWVPVLVVMPLVPCVLAIESGFKCDLEEEENGAKWNAHLLTVYMTTAYGSMGFLLVGDVGLWTCVSLAVCLVLLVLIAVMWLHFHKLLAALTAGGTSVLEKLDKGASRWEVRLLRACGGAAELDLSECGYAETDGPAARTRLRSMLMKRLGECVSLTELNLSGYGELRFLPEARWVYTVRGQQRQHRAPGLGACVLLTKLRLLDCTNLQRLPEELGECTALAELDLSGCASLIALPERLGECVALTEVTLSNCGKLRALPDGLGACVSLTRLRLLNCANLQELPERLGECAALAMLDVSGCTSLIALPEQLSNCAALAELDLSGCTSIIALPERLGECVALTEVTLSNCGVLHRVSRSAFANFALHQESRGMVSKLCKRT
jgi:hypothetical protein